MVEQLFILVVDSDEKFAIEQYNMHFTYFNFSIVLIDKKHLSVCLFHALGADLGTTPYQKLFSHYAITTTLAKVVDLVSQAKLWSWSHCGKNQQILVSSIYSHQFH